MGSGRADNLFPASWKYFGEARGGSSSPLSGGSYGPLGTLRHSPCSSPARSLLDTWVKKPLINKELPLWMGGRAVEGTGLENRDYPSLCISAVPSLSGFLWLFEHRSPPVSRFVSGRPTELGGNSGGKGAGLVPPNTPGNRLPGNDPVESASRRKRAYRSPPSDINVERCPAYQPVAFASATYHLNGSLAGVLNADLSITNTPRLDHAAYIANWLEVLKRDNRAIFTAARKAAEASDYLMSLQPEASA
jgi:hypothetical protein